MELYKDNVMPIFSDNDLKMLACVDCKKCETGGTNPKNPGCEGDMDTMCIPKTECKKYEIIESEGDHKTDRKCGPCKCPPEKYGIAKCEDNKIIEGTCADRTICKKGEYKYDDPIQYGDVTRDTICKTCRRCPPNSFQLAECSGSTDTVCKIHKECGKNQYVLKKGTDISDTICKCLDGYELPTVTDENCYSK